MYGKLLTTFHPTFDASMATFALPSNSNHDATDTLLAGCFCFGTRDACFHIQRRHIPWLFFSLGRAAADRISPSQWVVDRAEAARQDILCRTVMREELSAQLLGVDKFIHILIISFFYGRNNDLISFEGEN